MPIKNKKLPYIGVESLFPRYKKFESVNYLWTMPKISTNQKTHRIIFSTDLNQNHKEIIDYYSLRFQIEFNFRDAKQYFGMEDFMNNATYLLHAKSKFLKYSVNDIKSLFMAEKYTREVLKLYGVKVDEILINEAIHKVLAFSMIHGDVV